MQRPRDIVKSARMRLFMCRIGLRSSFYKTKYWGSAAAPGAISNIEEILYAGSSMTSLNPLFFLHPIGSRYNL
jgi:hypothetical protein